MKASMTRSEYQRLELISDSQSTDSQSTDSQSTDSLANYSESNSSSRSAATGLHHIWQSLLAYFSANAELRVQKTTDSAGKLIWRAYDPLSQARAEFDNELDLRIWIEERHYQAPERKAPYLSAHLYPHMMR